LEAFKKLLNEKSPTLFVLDIGQSENYKKRHIVGAVNIPLEELERRVREIPAGRQIVVYGENDVVSFQGGVILSDLGIFTAQTLSGNKYLAPESGLPFEP
jgi:rhodanese-related sulfurtransferase